MLYKRWNKLFFVLITAASLLTGCDATSFSYSADDIKYTTKAGDVVANVSRDVYKMCDGFTVSVLANVKRSDLFPKEQGNTGYVHGVITIGEDPLQTAAFWITEGGTTFEQALEKKDNSTVSYYISRAREITYNDKTYYCAMPEYQYGKIGMGKQKIYVSKFETLEEIALDVLSKCKFESYDHSSRQLFKYKENLLGEYTVSAAPYLLMEKGEVYIQTKNGDRNVEAIAEAGFTNLYGVDKIVIGNEGNVTKIYQKAFSSCPDLKYIVIPSTVTTIENEAFGNLKDLVFFDGAENKESRYDSDYVDSTFKEENHYYGYKDCFYNDEFLYGLRNDGELALIRYLGNDTNVVVPSSYNNMALRHIERDVFKGHENIETIFIEEGPITMGDRVFRDCKNLKYLRLPGSIATYGDDLFNDNYSNLIIFINGSASHLKDSNLPSGLKKIDYNCHIYENYTNYIVTEDYLIATKNLDEVAIVRYFGNEEEVAVPDVVEGRAITTIETGAFSYKRKIRHIKLPSNLKIVSDFAFMYCDALEEIVFPNGTKQVWGSHAFSNCNSLTYVILPESVTWFGNPFDPYDLNYNMQLTIYCYHSASSDFIQTMKNTTFKSYPNIKIYAKGEWALDANNQPYPLA